MRFLVRHDFRKSQPGSIAKCFGARNEGFVIEGCSAKSAIHLWNEGQRPGDRLNPFYLEITELKEKS